MIGIIPPNTNTGESKYSEYLINGLKESDFDIKVFKNPLLLNRPNIKIFMGSILLKKIISDESISILHNLDNLGPFLLKNNNNNNNKKFVLTVHDIAPVLLPQIHSRIMRFNFNNILPKLIRNSDSIIVPSTSTKKDLISEFEINKSKINVIHLGIDKTIFFPREANTDILKKYGIDRKYLLYVGGDNPRKNLKNLIKSFIDIYQDIDYNLVLIGPINKKNLLSLIKSFSDNFQDVLNRIIIPGYVKNDDLPILYSSASAFVFPSLYEGFGFPPLESMACGTPVIVSDNSSIREIVGNAGLFIKNPLNSNEISEKIIQIAENDKLKFKLKKRGFKQVNKFNWDTAVLKTIKLYDNMLNE
ncbi:glycosyltransferase family 4 protein [Methanobacterium alkalithermotolerans]|uniref:Glycosyltransferase family 4 protein n=1 Tax=Methanobacterium alkalithermotolerans TaxID=2731220 RepID=A0A8T8K2M4_9EURY|nr:glycosyltransferase family 1 protein [Methanobacterium alkalithermotolerans]QUH22624.1 glycosyltransferase family 4 protein [Methanobacterium alkalithermotolerans]